MSVTGTRYFGSAVSTAGDVDGDGHDDIVIGAYGTSSSTGAAYLFKGSATGLSTTPSATLVGDATSSQFGRAVSAAGDLDGDGYDDVVLAAPNRAGSVSSVGRIYIYNGSSAGLGTTASLTVSGTAYGEQFGSLLASVGDIDGDGSDDIIVGTPEASDGQGRISLFRGYADTDADGVADAVDCDSTDPSVGAAATWYLDTDGDGYGDPAAATSACTRPSGAVADSTDCDDADGSVNPAAVETCDTVDNDCDGTTDEDDATDASTWYEDADADGFGLASRPSVACSAPSGHVESAGDCDDADDSIHPSAVEAPGDGIDQDCDGEDRPSQSADSGEHGPAASDGEGGGKEGGCSAVPKRPDGRWLLFLVVLALRRRGGPRKDRAAAPLA